jgi:hypothetical protein
MLCLVAPRNYTRISYRTAIVPMPIIGMTMKIGVATVHCHVQTWHMRNKYFHL